MAPSKLPIAGAPGGPPYFHISCSKLAVLMFCTGGSYLLAWFHHNWWAIRLRSGRKISPIWRTLLLVIFAYPMLKGIKVTAEVHGVETRFSPIAIALTLPLIGWIAQFDTLLWPLIYLTIIPLVLVQKAVNAINVRMTPGLRPGTSYSRHDRFLVCGGGLLVILTLVGTYLAP